MAGLAAFLLVAGTLIATMPALARQWRDDRAGAIRTLLLSIACLVFCLIGIGLGLWLAMAELPGGGRPNALPALGFMFGWIFYACLVLMRAVPRYREPPRWLLRFGILDVVLMALIAGGFVAAMHQI